MPDMTADYTERALATLKEKGYRQTKPRRLVTQALSETELPLSPYELKDMLDAKGEKIDIVSIYRIIDCLAENHLVHRSLLHQGKVLKCQLEEEAHSHSNAKDTCHHFLVCQRCHRIQETHCLSMETMVQEVALKTGFQVTEHALEFVGLCQNCQ